MSKYPWASNSQKLQRAIEKCNLEQQPSEKRDARIKQLYISMGGKLVELNEDKKNNDMSEEIQEEKKEEVESAVETTQAEAIEETQKSDTEFSDTSLDSENKTEEGTN